ncbi:MAG: hypothetical protein LBQ36_09795, partial [Synergistaceae bacterium]|nr:hypothetical protein [Synergistaceae bacterium]
MEYNPDVHNRRSIRLKGFDYSQCNAYFVTICVQSREHLFGEIINGEMELNDAGEMIAKWHTKLHSKFNDIEPRTFVVM